MAVWLCYLQTTPRGRCSSRISNKIYTETHFVGFFYSGQLPDSGRHLYRARKKSEYFAQSSSTSTFCVTNRRGWLAEGGFMCGSPRALPWDTIHLYSPLMFQPRPLNWHFLLVTAVGGNSLFMGILQAVPPNVEYKGGPSPPSASSHISSWTYQYSSRICTLNLQLSLLVWKNLRCSREDPNLKGHGQYGMIKA